MYHITIGISYGLHSAGVGVGVGDVCGVGGFVVTPEHLLAPTI